MRRYLILLMLIAIVAFRRQRGGDVVHPLSVGLVHALDDRRRRDSEFDALCRQLDRRPNGDRLFDRHALSNWAGLLVWRGRRLSNFLAHRAEVI